MIQLNELDAYLRELLQPQTIQDYCPNGIQVAGRNQISKIVTGVTACQALVDAAIAANADAILVHHGYFWPKESHIISGMKKRRLKSLLTHEISLIAYHLPLDLHPVYGNNAQLAQQLGIEIEGQFEIDGLPLGFFGYCDQPMSRKEFAAFVAQKLQRQPLHIEVNSTPLERIAFCTGAAQQYILNAAERGFDAYLSGEISESTTHIAKECGIDYYAAGHHATERYGVQALGAHLEASFAIQHEFIDIVNPA